MIEYIYELLLLAPTPFCALKGLASSERGGMSHPFLAEPLPFRPEAPLSVVGGATTNRSTKLLVSTVGFQSRRPTFNYKDLAAS